MEGSSGAVASTDSKPHFGEILHSLVHFISHSDREKLSQEGLCMNVCMSVSVSLCPCSCLCVSVFVAESHLQGFNDTHIAMAAIRVGDQAALQELFDSLPEEQIASLPRLNQKRLIFDLAFPVCRGWFDPQPSPPLFRVADHNFSF